MALVVRALGTCPYGDALALQEELVARKQDGDPDDYLLVVEHEPVFTLGRGADARDLRGADVFLKVPVFRVSRGGGVTFHGPGQLVAYPIVALRNGVRDVHQYVRTLETILVDVCREFSIAAGRCAGVTGVWVQGAKIASIGIGIRHWITFHGVALNVSTDLSFFAQITPCRMPDVRMTSMARELGHAPSMDLVQQALVRRFQAIFAFSGAEAVEERA
jgi:lipoyl(octanoyl) transferase